MPSARAMPQAHITAIDSHAHVFIRGLPLAAQRRHAPDYDALLADYLAHLDRHGISHGVLVQPSFLGTDNHYFLDAIRQHPQRLRGVAMVAPEAGEDLLAALHAQGVVGIRLNLVGLALPDFAAAHWQTLFARVRALGWHVELHRDAQDLPAILDALLPSGCALVVDHFGRPDPLRGADDPAFAALLRAAGSGRVWVKLSAAYRHTRSGRLPLAERSAALALQDAPQVRATAAALLRAFGPERLLWGSDWPHTQHQDLTDFAHSRALLDDWVPNAAQRQAILVDTPAALFRFR
ncbi:amidohydrolase family protein [Xylophilus sp. GW821-FHT01B05]